MDQSGAPHNPCTNFAFSQSDHNMPNADYFTLLIAIKIRLDYSPYHISILVHWYSPVE